MKSVAALLSLLLSCEVLACRPLQSPLFEPTPQKYVAHREATSDRPLDPPRLTVETVRLIRGREGDGVSCSDAGTLEVVFRLDKNSPFSFEELGIYVVELASQAPWGKAYPRSPVEIRDGAAVLVFAWVDEHPRRQRPLHLHLAAFAVTHDRAIGPPVHFQAQSVTANKTTEPTR